MPLEFVVRGRQSTVAPQNCNAFMFAGAYHFKRQFVVQILHDFVDVRLEQRKARLAVYSDFGEIAGQEVNRQIVNHLIGQFMKRIFLVLRVQQAECFRKNLCIGENAGVQPLVEKMGLVLKKPIRKSRGSFCVISSAKQSIGTTALSLWNI